MLLTALLVFHILLALALIGIILIQQGRGAAAGAAFGAGASSTVFGSRGSASFLTRATTIMAVVFFTNCMVLAYLSSNRPMAQGVVEQAARAAEQAMPAPAQEAPPMDDVDTPESAPAPIIPE